MDMMNSIKIRFLQEGNQVYISLAKEDK
jgi:hypothetical protein